jgi:hypothetical protein
VRLGGLALSFFLSLALSSPVGQATPITTDEYLLRLQHAEDLAQAGTNDPSPQAMDAVRAALGLPFVITVPGGSLRVETDAFLQRLRGENSGDFLDAARHLEIIKSSVQATADAPSTDQAKVASALDRAYAEIALPSLWQRLGRYIRAAIVRLIRTILFPLVTYQGVGSWVAWSVLIGLLVILVLVLRRLGVHVVPERAALRPVPGFAATDWQGLAEQAIRRGDLRAATRALYHALVAALAARGVVAASPSVTAGECRSAVARAIPTLYPTVTEATKAFERVAYGGVPPEPPDIDALRMATREAAA